MARVTGDDVQQIINTTLDPLPFIEVASALVSDRLSSSGLSETILKEIERWLAAHFLSVRVPMKKSQSIDGTSETYHVPGVSMKGLESSLYGQQALLLDSSGTLANLGLRKVAFTAIDITLED